MSRPVDPDSGSDELQLGGVGRGKKQPASAGRLDALDG